MILLNIKEAFAEYYTWSNTHICRFKIQRVFIVTLPLCALLKNPWSPRAQRSQLTHPCTLHTITLANGWNDPSDNRPETGLALRWLKKHMAESKAKNLWDERMWNENKVSVALTHIILRLPCRMSTVDNELTNVFLTPAMVSSPVCSTWENNKVFPPLYGNIGCFVLSGGMMFNFTLIDLWDEQSLFSLANIKCMPHLCMAAGIDISARPQGKALNRL